MVTLAADHLFNVSETVVRLEEAEVRSFHRATARLLFPYNRSRLDIDTSVAFLTTGVKEPTDKYWKKLFRFLAYLKGTPVGFLTL